VESKWKNYHIITFPGQSLSKTLEEAMDLSQDRVILELEQYFPPHLLFGTGTSQLVSDVSSVFSLTPAQETWARFCVFSDFRYKNTYAMPNLRHDNLFPPVSNTYNLPLNAL
jgi:hypothetical protein